jgi:hypothetical protein
MEKIVENKNGKDWSFEVDTVAGFRKRTRMLFTHYNELKINQELTNELVQEIMMDCDERDLFGITIREKRTANGAMSLIDEYLEEYKNLCNQSDREGKAIWTTLQMSYLLPQRYKTDKIAERLSVDKSTVTRYRKKGIDEFSTILFGVKYINAKIKEGLKIKNVQ